MPEDWSGFAPAFGGPVPQGGGLGLAVPNMDDPEPEDDPWSQFAPAFGDQDVGVEFGSAEHAEPYPIITRPAGVGSLIDETDAFGITTLESQRRRMQAQNYTPEQIERTVGPASDNPIADQNMATIEHARQVARFNEEGKTVLPWARYLLDRAIPGVSSGKQLADAAIIKLATDNIDNRPLTRHEAMALGIYLNDQEDAQERANAPGRSGTFRRGGDIIANAPALMGEMLATGGAGTAVKKSVQSLAVRMLGRSQAKRMAARAAGGAAQVATQAYLMPQRYAKTAIERQTRLPGDERPKESWGESIAHGVGQHAVEVGTELYGGKALRALLGKPLKAVAGSLARNTPTLDPLRRTLVDAWAKLKGKSVQEGFKKVATATGWDGILEEIGEERLNELILGTAGALGAEGKEYDFGLIGDAASGDTSKAWDKFLSEMIAFGAIGGTMQAAQITANHYGPRTDAERIVEFMDSPTRRKWEKMPAEMRTAYPLDPKSTEQQRKDLAEKMRSDAESAARQRAGAPDVQAANPADIADAATPPPVAQNDVPAQDVPANEPDTTPADDLPPEEDGGDAPTTMSEQDVAETRDWIESLGDDELARYRQQMESDPAADDITKQTVAMMQEEEARRAADSQPPAPPEIVRDPQPQEGGDPNDQEVQGQGNDPQGLLTEPEPPQSAAGAGVGSAPALPPDTIEPPAVATGGTVAEGDDSAPLGSEDKSQFRFEVLVEKDTPDSKFIVWDSKTRTTKGRFDTREEANVFRDDLRRKAGFAVPKESDTTTPVVPAQTPVSAPVSSPVAKPKRSLDDIDSISDDDLDAAIAGKKPVVAPETTDTARGVVPTDSAGDQRNPPAPRSELSGEPRSTVSARNQREQWIRSSPEAAPAAKPNPDRHTLSNYFAKQLSSGKTYPTILEARKEAGEILGTKILAGTPETKIVDEAVEVGVVKAARNIAAESKGTERETFTKLGGLYQRQPTLGTRTSTSMVEQAYSTPAPLAYLASRLAGITKSSTVYEPTAGNGMLLIEADPKKATTNELNPSRAESLAEQGFTPTQLDAMETAPAAPVDVVIANPPFGKVKGESGAPKVFDVAGFKTNEIDQAISAKALESLKKDGRAVLILGAKGHKAKTPNDRKQAYLNKNKAFFEHLYNNFHVTDHFTVDGGLYARQGAGFPVDVIVIDGRKDAAPARPKPWQQEPQWFNTWDELGDAKLGTPVVDKLPPPAPPPKPPKNPPPPKPPKDDAPAPPPAPPKKDDILSDKTKEAQKAFADKAREMAKKYGNKTFSLTSLDPEVVKDFYDLTKLGLRAGVRTFADYVRFIGKTINMGIARQWSGAMGEAWTNLGEQFDGLDQVGNVNEVLDTVEAEIETENKKDEKPPEKPADSIDELAETEHQVKYESESKNPFSAGTLIPTNQRDAVMESLAKVREAHGDLDKYVAKELEMSAETFQAYFSSEQADALALAIHNYDRNGSALVLADQTGVGKGRVVAGMMRFANLRGMVPVFATEKASLFSDIIRDLTAIGENTGEPPFEFIATNDTTGENAVLLENDPLERTLKQGSAVSKRLLEEAIASKTSGGKFEAKSERGKTSKKTEYKAVFTTYSQVQTVKGAETWKRPAFRRLMPHAFLILDEAHNAGGTEESSGGRQSQAAAAATAADRAEFIREITMTAKGVMYSTATWAKRPSTTTLYNRTDMPQAMNGDVDHLPEAIEKGGVPLMQVVSQMLAEAGQLIRREKSFKGVKFEPKTVPVSIEDADKMTAIFREIADRFDPAIEDVMNGVRTDVLGEGGTIAANNATGPQAVTATNFSSMMWNAVDQMLFALKADKAADEAIEAYKNGETPVIAVDATMEAVLDEYLKENQVQQGDAMNLNFGDILHRYLERSRWYTVRLGTRDAQGNPEKERVRLSDEELNQDTQTGNALDIFNDIAGKIRKLAIDAPASPIDWIRYRLEQAGIKVAEVTGRKNVVHYTGKGKMTLGVRSEEEVGNTGKLKTIRDLNSGATGAILLNRSGSTGLSIHASKDFKNQKPRHMIIAQAAKNIDEFMQMLGRIHRTGQVVLPRYTLLMSNMPSENRPAAVLSKKLAKLNAAVTAKSKGAVGFDVPDVMNEVGGFVVQQFLQDNPEVNDMLGALPLTFGTGTPPVEWYEELARKATGKVSILPYSAQVEFWDAISQGFKDRIAQLDALGENPLIAKTLPLAAKTVEKFTLFEGDKGGGPFAQPAELEKVKAKIIGRPMTTQQVYDKLIEFYGMDSMLDFHREQSKWEGKSVYDITTEADAYREESAKGLATQAAVDRRLNMIDRQEQAIADAMRQYSPGNVVNVTIPGGELAGVVTGFKRVGKPKNPVQPSSWVVKVAVNDAIKEIDVPVSQISARLVPQSSSMAGILETFDRAQSVSTENRWIATGNLLAAFDRLSNQHVKVTFFTDDQGKTRSGLLLPRAFSAGQYLEKRPVVMDTAANALAFLQRGGAALYTPDGVMGITLAGNQLIFSAPAARSRSGKYTTNPQIRAAASPKEFITPPSSQRTTMIVEGEPAMKKVLAAVLGETSLQANVDRELARAILGITATGEKVDSDLFDKLDDSQTSGTDNMILLGDHGQPVDSIRDEADNEQTEATSVGQNQVKVDAQSTTEVDFPTSPGEIIRRLEKLFGVPIRSGNMGSGNTPSGKVLGRYHRDQKIVRRLKELYGELGVVSHEVGHSFNDDYPHVLKKMTLLARLDLKKLDYDQKQQRPREGFAEFIRRWMTDDVAKLRKDAPDYFQHFEDFLKFNPEAADALNYGRELVNRWRTGMTASQRNQAMIRDTREPDRPADESAGERLRDELNRKRTKLWIDWFDPGSFLKRIDEATDKAGYKRGTEESKLYDLFDTMNGTAANHAYRALEKGVHSVGEGTEHVYSRGLLDAFEEAKLSEPEKAEWTEWAISKRLLKLREKHGSDYAMPFQLDDINKVMDDFAGYDATKQKRFEKLGRAVHQFNDNLITMMRDAGLIGELEHDRIIGDLDFYLPLERIADRAHVDGSIDKLGLGGMLNVTSPLKRLSPKGSQLPVMHPILSTVYRAIRFYDAAIRQQITLQMAKQLDPQLGGAKGMGWLMSRVPPSRQPQRLDATKVWEEIKPDLKAQGLDVDAVDPDLLPESITLWKALHRPSYKDMVIRIMVPTKTLDPDTGEVTVEMKPVLYELDEMLHYSLDQMNPVELGSFLTVTKKLGDVVKMGAIGLNPEFALRNAINDWMGYQATATTGAESLVAPVANLAGYGVRKVTGTGTEFDDLYDEHVGNEGSKFGVGVRTPKDIAARLLKAGDQGNAITDALSSPLQALANAKRSLEDLIATSEVGPRYSEFLSVLAKNGFSLKQDPTGKWRSYNTATKSFERPPRHVLVLAKKAAADIMPFHRRGKAMRKVDALIPLFGAAITGMTKFVQTHRDAAKGVAGARQRLATFYILQMAAELALWAMFGDDDRDEERPEWMLSRHNVLGTTIPRGREWGIPGMLTRGLLNDSSGKGTGLKDAALESAKQFIPPHTAPITIPFEMKADFDFWRMRAIEGQNMRDDRLPVDRSKPWTRPAAKWLGENVGGLSPLQWDFAMDRLSGGMTGRLQDEAKDLKEGRFAATVPFVSGVVEKREYTRSIDDLYDALGKAKQEKGSGTLNKTLTNEQYATAYKLDKGADFVRDLRHLADGKDAATKDQYEKLAVGAARFFLGKNTNDRYPNPLTAKDLPADVAEAAKKLRFSIVNTATDQLSKEDRKRDSKGKFKSSDDDDSILASRKLLTEIVPTYSEARTLFEKAYKAQNGSLYKKDHNGLETSDKKDAVENGYQRLRRIYAGRPSK